jgi:hypothetical protein
MQSLPGIFELICMLRDTWRDIEVILKLIYSCKMKEEEWRAIINVSPVLAVVVIGAEPFRTYISNCKQTLIQNRTSRRHSQSRSIYLC